MFGPEVEGSTYREFARFTEHKTEEKICQSYLNWLASKQEEGNRDLFQWVKGKVSKGFENIAKIFKAEEQ